MPDAEVIQSLEQSIIDGDTARAEALSHRVIEEAVDIQTAIEEGLIKGIKKVGSAFGDGDAFLPDLIMSGEAMKIASDILEDALRKAGESLQSSGGKIVIGTVKGDVHDIGKTLVATIFKGAGFLVTDLGVDVPGDRFVEAVKQHEPDVLGLSSLLTTSAVEQKNVIDALQSAGLRSKVRVLVGGGAISEQWADEIGADGFAGDAWEAVQVADKLLNRSKENENA